MSECNNIVSNTSKYLNLTCEKCLDMDVIFMSLKMFGGDLYIFSL